MLYLRIVTNQKDEDDEEPRIEEYRPHVVYGGTPILKPETGRPPNRPRTDIRRSPNKPQYLPEYVDDDSDDPGEEDV